MKSVVYRVTLLLLGTILIAGCSSLQRLKLPQDSETKLFARGLDQYLATGELSLLNDLSRQFPQGQWRSRADSIIEMEQKHPLKERKENQEEKLAQCLQDIKTLSHEKEALTQDNKLLESTLNQLKEVLIDSELQPK